MNPTLVSFIYLVAGILFILGIKGLTKPKTAVRGNKLSALGMLIAVVVTLLDRDIVTSAILLPGCWWVASWARYGAENPNDLDAADGGSA